MNFEFMANLWFILITLVWSIYFAQEFFISGVGMLSGYYLKDLSAFKKINNSVGTHWDGIQVWLILAVGGTFAAFPHAFAAIFTALYIPVFLLLYVIIIRGTAIELIDKTPNLKLQMILRKAWIISSYLLISVLALYTFNVVIGFPISSSNFNDHFFSFVFIFNRMALLGAATFISLSLSLGIVYLRLNMPLDISKKVNKLGKRIPIVMIFLVIFLLIGLNAKEDIFTRGIYLDYPILWLLPVLSIICAIAGGCLTYLSKNRSAFILLILTIIFLTFTGYLSLMPNFIFSTVDESFSLSILKSSAQLPTLRVMFISTLIFLPIVIGYQGYKYYRFWGK